MPTKTGKDSKGCFAQWGSATKYYYKCGNDDARKRAIAKANKQGQAIRASGFNEKQTTLEDEMMESRWKGHLVKTKEITDSQTQSPFIDIQESQIDESNHMIKDVCVFGTRYSKNGYTYQDKAIETLNILTEGAKFFINHESKSERKDRDGVRDIRDWAGVFSNPKKKEDKVFADLRVRPQFWELARDVATMKPPGVGNSINTLVKVYTDDQGKEHIVDIDTLRSIDLVASAATTQNLFESHFDNIINIDESIQNIFENTNNQDEQADMFHNMVIDYTEGILSDEIKKRNIARKINELNWKASDLIYDIVRDNSIQMSDKKTKISSIMDDLDTEIQKVLSGKKSIIDKQSTTKENNEEEDMGLEKLTLDDLINDRPDLVKKIKEGIESNDKIKTLETENKELSDKFETLENQFKELTDKYEAVEKERDGLKVKVDEFETAQKKTQKESFIKEQVKEAKLPDEAVSDVFMEDLMSKNEDEIKKSIQDRKELWNSKKTVIKGAGEEFVSNDNKEVTKEKVESEKEKFKQTLGK